MERLSTRKKLSIIGQYFSGFSYDEITSKTGVSKGSVANVIAELKAGAFPETSGLGDQLELLRELSVDLKRSKLSPGQCATGLAVLDRIKECGLTPADIDRLPLILKSAGSEAEAQEFVNLVHSIEEVTERTGLSLDGLDNKVHALEKKASELEPIAKKRDDCRKELAGLAEQRNELTALLAGLKEKYDILNPRVKDLEKREQDLLRRNKEMEDVVEKAETTLAALKKEKQRLMEIGLSLEGLGELNQVAQSIAKRYKVTSTDLMSRMLKYLKNLDKAMSLEEIVAGLKKEIKEKERAASLAQQRLDNLEADIGSSKQEKERLEANIKHTREELGNEIAKIIPSARDAITQLKKEMQSGHDEALTEMRRLMDEIIGVGKDIGRLEQIVQSSQWLIDLLVLVRGDDNIAAEQVQVIVLKVLRGFAVWLKRNEAHNFRFSLLLNTVMNLIKEIELWKV